MQARSSFPPLIEAFLIIEQPRQRLSHWLSTLASLDTHRAPPLAQITAYWDPVTDHALLSLRYDELALGPKRLEYVIELALLAEIGMIQPAELVEGERRRFLAERLARCTIQVSGQRNVVGAVSELARQIREHKKGSGVSELPKKPAAKASMRPNNVSEVQSPVVHAKGTRDDLDRDQVMHSTHMPALDKPAGHESLPAVPLPPRTASPNVINRSQRVQTVDMPPQALQEILRQTREGLQTPPGALPAVATPAGIVKKPERDATGSGPMPTGIIYARYLRSGRWVPVRIGALSLKGAALMTGALPRVQDHVDVALTFGDHRALVRGPVNKVSSVQEAQLSGAATFSVSFDLDDTSKRQLTTLLTAARKANVIIKPPPPRANRRFPVEWPVCIGTTRGAIRANALDISAEGLFVRPQNPLSLDWDTKFSAVLDDDGPPITGIAKVVRRVTDTEARASGLIAGWGLKIVEMTNDDRPRWSAFLARIEKRSEKRVLIGASPARLSELQAGLAAAGYAVTGGTDAGALLQLVSAETRPVDAAMIDGGWLTAGTPTQLVEAMFTERKVPCVTVHGVDGRRARATIDKLLSVL